MSLDYQKIVDSNESILARSLASDALRMKTEIATLRSQLAEAREGLKPFATFYDIEKSRWHRVDDSCVLVTSARGCITIGDLRRAASIRSLSPTTPAQGTDALSNPKPEE